VLPQPHLSQTRLSHDDTYARLTFIPFISEQGVASTSSIGRARGQRGRDPKRGGLAAPFPSTRPSSNGRPRGQRNQNFEPGCLVAPSPSASLATPYQLGLGQHGLGQSGLRQHGRANLACANMAWARNLSIHLRLGKFCH
jgi:hypothetical protein